MNSLYEKANHAISNGELVLVKRLSETISKIAQMPEIENQKSPMEIVRERRAMRDKLMQDLERRLERINKTSEN